MPTCSSVSSRPSVNRRAAVGCHVTPRPDSVSASQGVRQRTVLPIRHRNLASRSPIWRSAGRKLRRPGNQVNQRLPVAPSPGDGHEDTPKHTGAVAGLLLAAAAGLQKGARDSKDCFRRDFGNLPATPSVGFAACCLQPNWRQSHWPLRFVRVPGPVHGLPLPTSRSGLTAPCTGTPEIGCSRQRGVESAAGNRAFRL